MDILEFALEKERLSREYYQNLADSTNHTGLKNILSMLIEQESEHCRVIEQLKNHTNPELRQFDFLGDAKKQFEQMKVTDPELAFHPSELELYREARAKELKSRQFYLEKADETDDPAQEDIFHKLADEENKHYILLDNICDFVEEPEWYLENAEFSQIENYPV